MILGGKLDSSVKALRVHTPIFLERDRWYIRLLRAMTTGVAMQKLKELLTAPVIQSRVLGLQGFSEGAYQL